MENANTATPCELIAWAMGRGETARHLMISHLRRVAQTDLDFANGGGPTFARQALEIARKRAADLFSDATRIASGREPETFCGRLNALEWACSHAAISSNARASIFERGPLITIETGVE